ncbi:neprilysin-21-like [Musca vetustissima]|uniref:neprilysin-21-like n=1 Tax=Musca vetustissima TaxID=27455 RepID=UPI002AB6750E|nr:neprilysin-21-like [Musca vetustissima]
MKLRRIIIALLLIIGGGLLADAASQQMANFVNRRQQKLIEGSMDVEVDPCEDFYQYACGKWEEYVEGAGFEFAETLSMMDFRANKDFMDYMNKLKLWKSPRFVKKAYAFYKSCMDVQLYESQLYLNWLAENEQLKLASLFGDLETNHDLGEEQPVVLVFDWIHTLAVMWKYGMNGVFLELTAFYPKENPLKLTIDLDKPLEVEEGGAGFKSLTYRNLKEIIRSLDGLVKPGEFSKIWNKFHKFEEKLVELKETTNLQPNESEQIALKDLPLERLEKYLRIALNQTICDNQIELYIQNVHYFKALDDLLKGYESAFISQYLQIRFLWHMREQRPPIFTAEGCIVPTRGLLSLAMHWIYEQQKPHIEEAIPEIQNVGNLPRWNTSAVLEKYYENLTLSVNDFYGNHLKLLAFQIENKKYFYKTLNDSNYFHLEEYDTAASPSPYFIHKDNMVMLPSTAVQRPLYHHGHEDVYKYSSLGFLLAHEILHAFDINGLEMDSNGMLNSSHYHEILANSKFTQQLKCLRRLNPMVINEKISDVSGLRYAYETFFNQHSEAVNRTRRIYGREMALPKLFFLNFAQFFCGSISSVYYVSVNEHGSDRDRVNDAVSQFPEFAKVFNCSVGSRMQANESCNLWR